MAKIADNDRRAHFGFYAKKLAAQAGLTANTWTRITGWRSYHSTPSTPGLFVACP